MRWLRQHRRAAIWIGALVAVGVVYVLRSRASSAASSSSTPTAATGTVSQPASDYATGYDSGFTAGLGSTGVATSGGGGGGTVGTGGGGGGGGGKGGAVKGHGAAVTARLDQILKDLEKPGLAAARRARLIAAYHSITGKTYNPQRNPYRPKHGKPSRRRTGAGKGTNHPA